MLTIAGVNTNQLPINRPFNHKSSKLPKLIDIDESSK